MSESTLAQKECFVVCPIGAAGSETRKRSDQIYRHIVSATLQPMGYIITRGDSIEQSGQITSQVIDKLLNVDLVVADLTDQNANVFYELAVRHAVRKPFVQMMAENQKLPFDIQSLRTIFFSHTDLDSVHEAKQSLAAMTQALEQGGRVETPMTYTLDLQSLRQSEDSEARGIAEIIEEITSLKRSLTETRLQTRKSSSDLPTFRRFVEALAASGRLQVQDRDLLVNTSTSRAHDQWIDGLISKLDPWATAPQPSSSSSYDDEPPF